ncbi:hypothetical protein HLH36_14965 [Gluconacetobacter aggeris]|uniref:Pectate lyase-like protein n=1 Tax=Gluconacetobacter aggeris TaxID=1286186 RepID=A0A7W4IV64_9PROT|nr:hypothetical protein [Gluconacetobacter aggeris]MBB2169636.1 hypothetical protein [Gluconacetobacter aggeris]
MRQKAELQNEHGMLDWSVRDGGLRLRCVVATVTIVFACFCGAREAECATSDGIERLEAFGARCDGKVDDTKAISAWLATIRPHAHILLTAPPGRCVFSAPLATPAGGASDVTIRGSGPYSTVFVYNGSRRDADLLVIGDGRNGYVQFAIGDFSITSSVPLTDGAAIHLRGLQRSVLSNIIIDGQDGTGYFWNGIWFDGIDDVVTSGQNYAAAQRDAVRVNGIEGLGLADLTLSGWKISPVNGGKVDARQVGLHLGGGFGGLYCTGGTDIIGNGTNVLIDTSLNPILHNREASFDGMCALDSSRFGPGLALMEEKGGNYLTFAGGWVASSYTYGLYIAPKATGWLSFVGGTIYNNGEDGVFSASSEVLQTYVGTHFRHNGMSRKGAGLKFRTGGQVSYEGSLFEGNREGAVIKLP